MIYGTLAPPVFLPRVHERRGRHRRPRLPHTRVFLIVFSAALIAALWFGVERTRWGAWCARRSTTAAWRSRWESTPAGSSR